MKPYFFRRFAFYLIVFLLAFPCRFSAAQDLGGAIEAQTAIDLTANPEEKQTDAEPLNPGYEPESAPAAPVGDVVSRDMDPENPVPVLVELFSSQACVFCPQADRYFGELLKKPGIIGISCHVDYFDVRDGALSHEFCTARQESYISRLGSGPAYTPQMVVNGRDDVVGYKFEKVEALLAQQKSVAIQPLDVVTVQKNMLYGIEWPRHGTIDKSAARLWVALYDKPHKIKIATGMNKGQDMTYMNIVSHIENYGIWSEHYKEEAVVKLPVVPEHAGMVFMIEDVTSGHIIAAGEYKLPSM